LESEVVVYTALDQIFSEPLLQQFERETGIRVRPVYDTESAKTVGLVNRLLSEKASPRCDVFWNNEILRTLLLKREGVTQPYDSPNAAAIPAVFRDPERHWTGFAARARVIIYNKDRVSSGLVPTSRAAFTDPRWRGRCAIANPFFLDMKANGVVQMPGNSMVRDQVALGEMAFGLTDSDDANGALLDKRPVGITYPMVARIGESKGGIVLLPNTVCLVAGCPHPEAGKKLIDFLLSPGVEEALAKGRSAQFPLHPGVAPPPGWEAMGRLPWLEVDWNATLEALAPSAEWLDANFVR
jgi:iron(III) transport system substrate-binding protein